MGLRIKYINGDILGSNNIVYLCDIDTDPYTHRLGKFRCHCGKEFIYRIDAIKNNTTVSCGCMKDKGNNTRYKYCCHPLYNTLSYMKQRCYNPNSTNYVYYGCKNIKVCDEWLDPEVFIEWALANGWKPELSIHRKDSSKDYMPSNCIWLTKSDHAKLHYTKLHRR